MKPLSVEMTCLMGIQNEIQAMWCITTVNDLPNEFALTRLGKKVMWGGSHKVSSYQTLVKRPM
jgi:hypothetical protein